jgi:hypothetical protein
MPTSKQRHRVEIDGALYDRLKELATREGYPVARFTDKLLHLAVHDYVEERKKGRWPFARWDPDPLGPAR